MNYLTNHWPEIIGGAAVVVSAGAAVLRVLKNRYPDSKAVQTAWAIGSALWPYLKKLAGK